MSSASNIFHFLQLIFAVLICGYAGWIVVRYVKSFKPSKRIDLMHEAIFSEPLKKVPGDASDWQWLLPRSILPIEWLENSSVGIAYFSSQDLRTGKVSESIRCGAKDEKGRKITMTIFFEEGQIVEWSEGWTKLRVRSRSRNEGLHARAILHRVRSALGIQI